MYFSGEDHATHDAEIAQHRLDRERSWESARCWANVAKVTFCLAIGAFIGGVLFAIDGLSWPTHSVSQCGEVPGATGTKSTMKP